MKLHLTFVIAVLFALSGCQSSSQVNQAGIEGRDAELAKNKVKVVWHEPDKFRDIQPANEHKGRFRTRLMSSMNDFLQELGNDLPKGVTLKLTFTNMDLAGRVQHALGFGEQMRIVSSQYWPQMKFDLVAKQNDKTILNEKFELKDMMFMDRATPSIRKSELFRYEKRMLKSWFYNELLPQLKEI